MLATLEVTDMKNYGETVYGDHKVKSFARKNGDIINLNVVNNGKLFSLLGLLNGAIKLRHEAHNETSGQLCVVCHVRLLQ